MCQALYWFQTKLYVLYVLITQSCPTLCDPMNYSPPVSSVHGIPGKNTGVGSHSFPQGIFPTQGSNPGLLLCRQIFFTIWANRENHLFKNKPNSRTDTSRRCIFPSVILLLGELVLVTDINTCTHTHTHTPHQSLNNVWLNIITPSTIFCFQMSFTLKIMVGQAVPPVSNYWKWPGSRHKQKRSIAKIILSQESLYPSWKDKRYTSSSCCCC